MALQGNLTSFIGNSRLLRRARPASWRTMTWATFFGEPEFGDDGFYDFGDDELLADDFDAENAQPAAENDVDVVTDPNDPRHQVGDTSAWLTSFHLGLTLMICQDDPAVERFRSDSKVFCSVCIAASPLCAPPLCTAVFHF